MISLCNIVTAKCEFCVYLLFYLMAQVNVCLRYDRSLPQRKDFIHEAEMAASLNHENILRLHGVVLPGLYIDSVALVCIFVILISFLHFNFCQPGNLKQSRKEINDYWRNMKMAFLQLLLSFLLKLPILWPCTKLHNSVVLK